MADARWIDSTLGKDAIVAPVGNEVFRAISDPSGTPVSANMALSAMKSYVLGGLSVVAISQASYDALDPPDPNTIYFISE